MRLRYDFTAPNLPAIMKSARVALVHGPVGTWRVAVLASCLMGLGIGARPARADGRACVPGVQIECSCLGQTKAVQVCAPDGASFLPCQCASATPAPPAAPAPVPFGAMSAPASTLAPGDAVLDISAALPATITLDDAEVGRTPVHITAVKPGVYVIRAVFDGGAELTRKVRILSGEVARVVFEAPPTLLRRGHHQAFGVSAGMLNEENKLGGGIAPEYDLNIGISKGMDFRVGGRLLLGPTDKGFVTTVGVPVSVRFNLGSTYSIGLGGSLGLRVAPAHHSSCENVPPTVDVVCASHPTEMGFFAGPEIDPLVLHLGAKRGLEVALVASALFPLTTTESEAYVLFHFGIGFTYVLL